MSRLAASTWTKVTNPPRTEGHPFNVVVLNDGTLVATYSARRATVNGVTAWQMLHGAAKVTCGQAILVVGASGGVGGGVIQLPCTP